jgi:hypothetical protein
VLYRRRVLASIVGHNLRISHSTKKIYAGYLKKWIEPRWGKYALKDIRAVEVELWLKEIGRAPGTCCKIRNVMRVLFNHGLRPDLCDRNPIKWVRQSAKLRTAPDVLTSSEACGRRITISTTILQLRVCRPATILPRNNVAWAGKTVEQSFCGPQP